MSEIYLIKDKKSNRYFTHESGFIGLIDLVGHQADATRFSKEDALINIKRWKRWFPEHYNPVLIKLKPKGLK